MKICIFSRPFHPAIGGLEQIAKTIAIQFTNINCTVEVVTDTPNDSNDDIQFPFVITRTSSFRLRYAAFKRSDVVLFMNFTFAGVPVALLSGTPIVLSHHGIYRFKDALKTQLIEFSKRQLTRFFRNISVSQFVANNIPGKSVVVPNAYDNNLFNYSYAIRSRDFVFCGRLVSDKGVDVLIDAFKRVLAVYPKATLTIIGDGSDKEKLEVQANSLINENVHFTGVLRNKILVDKLKEHTCMVIPSLWEEPFGIVALEGIASCDTVISSNRGGLPEAVGNCGVLINPTVENLAATMQTVLRAREQGVALPGQPTHAQRTAHLLRHAPKQVAQRYLDVCRAAIQS
jgi:glycosyltransferase involved in cell wall biosynthesis